MNPVTNNFGFLWIHEQRFQTNIATGNLQPAKEIKYYLQNSENSQISEVNQIWSRSYLTGLFWQVFNSVVGTNQDVWLMAETSWYNETKIVIQLRDATRC